MVEGTPLLRAQTGDRLEGSNPFGSAILYNFSIVFQYLMRSFENAVPHFIPHLDLHQAGTQWISARADRLAGRPLCLLMAASGPFFVR